MKGLALEILIDEFILVIKFWMVDFRGKAFFIHPTADDCLTGASVCLHRTYFNNKFIDVIET